MKVHLWPNPKWTRKQWNGCSADTIVNQSEQHAIQILEERLENSAHASQSPAINKEGKVAEETERRRGKLAGREGVEWQWEWETWSRKASGEWQSLPPFFAEMCTSEDVGLRRSIMGQEAHGREIGFNTPLFLLKPLDLLSCAVLCCSVYLSMDVF